MGVFLDNLEGAMSQNFSYCPHRDSLHCKVTGTRVTQIMPSEILNPGFLQRPDKGGSKVKGIKRILFGGEQPIGAQTPYFGFLLY